jgi:hypothetical protein
LIWYQAKDVVDFVKILPGGTIDFQEWLERVPREYVDFFNDVIQATYDTLYSDIKPLPGQERQFVETACLRLKEGPPVNRQGLGAIYYLH